MARFLNILLEPLLRRTAHSLTFVTASEAMKTFEIYAKQGHLRWTTLLITLHFHNLPYMFSHQFIMISLQDFLQTYTMNEQIQGISTMTILQLIELFLQNQYFIYDNKFYQQTSGSTPNAPLTTTLVNLYLLYWQQNLVTQLENRKEIFVRYFDQIFLTWNGSKEEFQMIFDQLVVAHDQYVHLHIKTSIGQQVQYLDAEIGHIEGILQNKVYHRSIIEPYALPYVCETTMSLSHMNLLRAALIRAIIYCSNLDEFENERFYIELSFMINDASYDCIQETIENIFKEFGQFNDSAYFNEDIYQDLRQFVRQNHRQRTKYHIRQQQRRQRRRQHQFI